MKKHLFRFGQEIVALAVIILLTASCATTEMSNYYKPNTLSLAQAEAKGNCTDVVCTPESKESSAETTKDDSQLKEKTISSRKNSDKKMTHVDFPLNENSKLFKGIDKATRYLVAPAFISKKVTAAKKKALMVDGYLRYALIFFIVAIILYLIAWAFPPGSGPLRWIFNLAGTVFFILALVFLLLWVLDNL